MNYDQIQAVLNELKIKYSNIELVSNLKSGKEADVYAVSADGKLMALKIYRPNTKYSTRLEYMDLAVLKHRDRKAILQKSKAGRKITQAVWSSNEFHYMKKLYAQGAFIPEPLACTQNAILMEFIGDENGPAPRLSEVRLNPELAEEVFDKILYNIDLFLANNIVHGDLSPFNILLWENDPIIIDFPQITELQINRSAREKLARDLRNVAKYFEKYLGEKRLKDLDFFLRL